MGKRIISRARGKGGPRYKAPSHRYYGKVGYFPFANLTGRVVDIVHDLGRSAPVAIIRSQGKDVFHIAAEGLKVGDYISYDGELSPGNVLPLGKVPEGTKVFAVESFPNSGPKFGRASGSYLIVLGKSGRKVSLQFPSGKIIELDERCRATVGVPAGGGRTEKPWVKVGLRWYAMHKRGKIFPRTAGVAMTPTDHPYGGKSKRPRPSKVVGRSASPGQKVGSIAAKRVGKRKGR